MGFLKAGYQREVTKWNFSQKVHDLMKLHGFHDAASEYLRSPGRFAPKGQLEKAWTEFHQRRVSIIRGKANAA